ncbi:MAG: hypothetical protein IKR57_05790 [Bacilli bacterium]|nr:hypothetical protein [Bacilli bacterium]
MLSLFDFNDNLDYEYKNTKEVDVNKIRDLYDESNLLFIMGPNRMNPSDIIFMFDDMKICFFDGTKYNFKDIFPNAYVMENNSKYNLYDCGFGSLLYVDKKIDDIFRKELIKYAEDNEVAFINGLPIDSFIRAYWITIAKECKK